MTNPFWNIFNHFASLEINGPQAEEFLQGQFTCDIRSLSSGQAILGACCDPKGRMLASGWIGKLKDCFFLFLPSDLLKLTMEHLQKYAAFSKVRLQEAPSWQVLICSEECPLDLSSENILKGKAGPIHWLFAEGIQITPAVSSEAIDLILIKNFIAFVQPATRGLFIPQMLGLEKLGGVSFNKGCYVGQEVVARTQHLGQLKRHLQILLLADKHVQACPVPGDTIINEQNEIMGHVAACAPDPKIGFQLLAVIQDRALPYPLFTSLQQPLALSN